MLKRKLCALVLLAVSSWASAQQAPAPLTPRDRHEVIESLSTQLQSRYVFPDAGAKLAAALRDRDAAGAYASANDGEAFAHVLAQDMRKLGDDGHFNVEYDPAMPSTEPEEAGLPDAATIERGRREMAAYAYGIDSLARLPGNVGYIEVRGFGPTELVSEGLSAAMTVLAGSDALIIDPRRNGGGEPQTVAHLMSHFFPIGDQRHLNDIYSRKDDATRQYWTDVTVMPRYAGPVYVLTSARTFSGGEEFAYDMQTQKRANLVGETTGGGSNPGDMVPLGHGFAAFIPHSRAINPVTHTNWEHVGVKPDIAVPAAGAKQAAYVAALQGLVAAATDADAKAELQDALAKAKAGIVDAPVYTPRR